jgi:hypothetical protein
MTWDDLLHHQRDRGPLPLQREGLAAWISALSERAPLIPLEVPHEAVTPLRAIGLVVDDQRRLRFPADGDALDRVFSLLGLPPLAAGGAAALLDARARSAEQKSPGLSLPLRVQPAKACSLGWSSDLFSLTVLVSNVSLREADQALLPAGGPIVGVCAEYERPLTSLHPPRVASFPLGATRENGVPTLRLPEGGFLRSPIRLEATSRNARAPAGRASAMARAGKFMDDLEAAWPKRIGSVTEIAWPVYRPEHGGPPLDAVNGAPLPEIALR